MGKDLYFDIQLGASGDMLLGAIIDLGLNTNELLSKLKSLSLNNWEISPQQIVRNSISGILANVKCKDDTVYRNLKDIQSIIQDSKLGNKVKSNIINIFQNLAKAEAKVHGKGPEQIHFHEIGAIDSIIDISAFCVAIDILEIENIYFNEFHLGSGTINSAHGEIPLPVPAVIELIKGFKSKITEKNGEVVTPTAAAILSTLGKQVTECNFSVVSNGTGFGTREYSFASYTRVFLIETGSESDDIIQIECNIDDMNPQLFPVLTDQLLNAGALDAYTCNISMKKGRPGILLTIITDEEKIEILKNIIYSNSTTLGLRFFKINREKLLREYKEVNVFGQSITIKIGYLNNKVINIHPEFEDCKNAANMLNIPLKEIISEAVYKYKMRMEQSK